MSVAQTETALLPNPTAKICARGGHSTGTPHRHIGNFLDIPLVQITIEIAVIEHALQPVQ